MIFAWIVQTFSFFQKSLCRKPTSRVTVKAEAESLCNISTNIDQDLGRFNSLETETTVSCLKKNVFRLMFVAQGPTYFPLYSQYIEI